MIAQKGKVELRKYHVPISCRIFKFVFFVFTVAIMSATASAEVYVGDHFDNQADYDGCGGGSLMPSPWGSYNYFEDRYCNHLFIGGDWGDAHGSTGKSLKLEWPQAMSAFGLDSWHVADNNLNEFWFGFWWKHDAGWDWGGDRIHKWVYLPTTNSGDRIMLNYDHEGGKNGISIIPSDGQNYYATNIPFDTTDGNWHYFVIYLKHSSGTGLNDGQLRLWRDGVEAAWANTSTETTWDNTHIDFGSGSTWTSFMNFGYQSRPDWGPGNTSYYDDIVIASTRVEVEEFLGLGDTASPSSNSSPIANAGTDQMVTDDDGDGMQGVVLNGTGSSDLDGQIVSYIWQEGSTALGNTVNPAIEFTVGSHVVELVVIDDEGAQATDTVNVVIQPPDSSSLPPSGDGTVLLEENFDNNLLSDRGWYDSGASNAIIVNDSTRQSNVLEIEYAAGEAFPPNSTYRHLFEETDSVYLEYVVKYEQGWSWTGQEYGPHEFYFLTNADHEWKGMAETHLTFYVENVNGQPNVGIQDALNIDTSNINVDLTNITENRAVAGCNGDSDGYLSTCYESGGWMNGKSWRATSSTVQNDRWYNVAVFIKLNSIVNGKGITDGQIKYWLDGQLVLSKDNVLFRTGAQAELKIKQIVIGPYFHGGVPSAQKFWIDNVSVKDGYSEGISPVQGFQLSTGSN